MNDDYYDFEPDEIMDARAVIVDRTTGEIIYIDTGEAVEEA